MRLIFRSLGFISPVACGCQRNPTNDRQFTGMGVSRNGHLFFVVLEHKVEFSPLEMLKSGPLASSHNQETKRKNLNMTDKRAAERQELTLQGELMTPR